MIVVPALAEREQGEQPVVAAVIVGAIAPPPEDVGERIDHEGHVRAGDRGDEEPPHEHLPAAGAELRRDVARAARRAPNISKASATGTAISNRSSQRSSGKRVRSRTRRRSGVKPSIRQEPAHVRSPEAVLRRRVRIRRPIGVRMMVAVMGRPPDRPALHRGGAEQSERKLHRPRGLEGAMREVAVIEGGDGEHPDRERRHRNRDRDGATAHRKHTEASHVQQDEGDYAPDIDRVTLGCDCRSRGAMRVVPTTSAGRPAPSARRRWGFR